MNQEEDLTANSTNEIAFNGCGDCPSPQPKIFACSLCYSRAVQRLCARPELVLYGEE